MANRYRIKLTPEGREMLEADKAAELKIASTVSTMTVQRALKKRIASSPGQILEDSTR